MWSNQDLLDELKGVGILRTPLLERSLRAVRQEAFLPEAFASLAYADMPLPMWAPMRAPAQPSARCLVAALELLEPEEDARILVTGSRGGYSAAVLARIAGPDRVVVVEPDEERRSVAADRLRRAGFEGVRVRPDVPDESFHRILILDATSPRDVARFLADPGFLIARGRGVHDLSFIKLVRQGGETLQITFSEAPSGVIAGPRDTESVPALDFGRLFAVEDLLVHAWEGRVTGHYDQHFRDIVDETFAGGPLDTAAFDPHAEPSKDGARRAFQAAYILQSAGELERAADAYERSFCLAPSAEAHTFHGWACSFMGRYADAIESCKRAIDVDPTFGNPYNDIGAYLIELGQIDEAIPWLEKAIAAPRYCCYFYAYTNLARVYLQKGWREKARKALLKGLEVNPDYEPARELLRRFDHASDYFA